MWVCMILLRRFFQGSPENYYIFCCCRGGCYGVLSLKPCSLRLVWIIVFALCIYQSSRCYFMYVCCVFDDVLLKKKHIVFRASIRLQSRISWSSSVIYFSFSERWGDLLLPPSGKLLLGPSIHSNTYLTMAHNWIVNQNRHSAVKKAALLHHYCCGLSCCTECTAWQTGEETLCLLGKCGEVQHI